MPICPLPQETVRLLGSPLVYSSPVAVVKELVDNALDARATSVEVLISLNTIDNIEVRDNGHGIHPSDFESLGHRGCTSKLRSFEDLQLIGGTTLGFRGDAIACAANLAVLQIITRTAIEPTASKLYLSEKGGVAKMERVAGSVGTTVKATGLFARIPVRRQVALKEATKTLSKIRGLLHSYAFARPQVKLSLRVHDRSQSSWSYSPGIHGNIKQAAFQVFGPDLTSQCLEYNSRVAPVETDTIDDPVESPKCQRQGVYTIEALLPEPGADPAKISKGAWISIDSRPVLSSSGAIQTLYSAFKARLKMKLELNSSATTLKHPFLAANISCPQGSYDPNVEPAKNEVLFANPHHLVAVFERFLEEVYPLHSLSLIHLDVNNETQFTPKSSKQASEDALASDRNPHFLSPKDTSPEGRLSTALGTSARSSVHGSSSTGLPVSQDAPGSPRMTASDIRKVEQGSISHYKSPPSSDDPEAGVAFGTRPSIVPAQVTERTVSTSAGRNVDIQSRINQPGDAREVNEQAGSRDNAHRQGLEAGPILPLQGLNPWVIAKFKALRDQSDGIVHQPVQQAPLVENDFPPTILGSNPQRSQHGAGMPSVVHLDHEIPPQHEVFGAVRASALPALRVPGGAYRSPLSGSRDHFPHSSLRELQPPAASRPGLQGAYRSSRETDSVEEQRRRRNRQQVAQDEQGRNWFQGSLDFTGHGNKRRQRQRPGGSNIPSINQEYSGTVLEQEPVGSPHLGAIRRRQVLAETRRLRRPLAEWLGSSESNSVAEQVAPAKAALEPDQAHREVFMDKRMDNQSATTELAPGDPRALLKRKECRLPATTTRKLRRVKSSMLPLESTPAGGETYKLLQTVHVDIRELSQSFEIHCGTYLAETNSSVDNDFAGSINDTYLKTIRHRVTQLLPMLGFEAHDDCQVDL